MKPTLLLVVAFLVSLSTVQAQVVYVKSGGHGDGTSWENATGNLSQALLAAEEGTQIWVAAGTYQPTNTTDRSAAFVIPSGVAIYGGFNGTETALDQRDVQANPTILSGEIGQPGPADNSYNVIYMSGVNEHTILDGFVITGGNANLDAKEGDRTRSGGGMYIGNSVRPQIINCTFTSNLARDGAAIYINGRTGECSPQFFSCVFKENEAGLDGGAVYNDGRQSGLSNPAFVNCEFYRNVGTYGGAICSASDSGVCNLTMEGCSFIENVAFLRGGAIFSLNGDEKCYLDLAECNFTGNYPDDQNMVFVSGSARAEAYAVEKSRP